MNRLLVDTNVFYDFFALRHPFDREAELLLFGCAMGDFEIWISSSQVTDLYFLLTHGNEKLSSDEATLTLKRLRENVRIASLAEDDIDGALAAEWSDFEDACVFFVAKHLKAHYIVTRNTKDFARSSIPVLTPAEYLELMREEYGVAYDGVEL